MSHTSGSPFPLVSQELLLKAALLRGEEMLTAFRKWKNLVDFEKDIEYASFRMLPLLYQNLHNNDVTDELMPRLKGIYRNSWSKNQFLFYKTGSVLKLFHQAGIKTIVMKGIPLSILIYKNYSTRPMADMDILILFSKADSAVELLKKYGWELHNPQYLEYNLKYGRSVTFTDKNKTELDLHWHPIFEAHDNISEDDFWGNTIPFQVGGIKTLSFCVTDLFFHTIVHGLRYNPEPPIRWIADAMAILYSPDYEIDWERLLHHTKKFRVVLYMKDALKYLAKEFHADIPKDFFSEINKIKVTSADRLIFNHAQKYGDKTPETFYEKIYSVYAGYIRQTSKNSFWGRQIGFLKYMRYRTRGKPYFGILVYQVSLFLKKNNTNPKR